MYDSTTSQKHPIDDDRKILTYLFVNFSRTTIIQASNSIKCKFPVQMWDFLLFHLLLSCSPISSENHKKGEYIILKKKKMTNGEKRSENKNNFESWGFSVYS